MSYPSVFEKHTTELTLNRLEQLNSDSTPLWGKMNAAQMLAHVNVSYDVAFEKLPVKNGSFMKFMLKTFLKNAVVGPKPYPKNSRTAPYFIQDSDKDFEKEKANFIKNVQDVESKGKQWFEGKESVSFGAMTAEEWSNLFYKHLDHHFQQFGI
jgi:hypothetical protein